MAVLAEPEVEVTRIAVWECVGCGRIDHPRPCVGICRDRKAEYVPAEEHDAAIAAARGEAAALREVVERIALTTPRAGGWEATYIALQARARELLARIG
ncbi:hypothetical protein [Usitatibacter palustris]|uniref:Uncharacterized protein n=1 Tax=Usitatibacter palustris TaxID=2732487 RepID=A0A6M4H420_9PROT|nr:hypothetical protein [Usitatibacter palustris]QJR14266.1 hypothetical protein DSM104440_01059 [Usitatibacter palustris]